MQCSLHILNSYCIVYWFTLLIPVVHWIQGGWILIYGPLKWRRKASGKAGSSTDGSTTHGITGFRATNLTGWPLHSSQASTPRYSYITYYVLWNLDGSSMSASKGSFKDQKGVLRTNLGSQKADFPSQLRGSVHCSGVPSPAVSYPRGLLPPAPLLFLLPILKSQRKKKKKTTKYIWWIAQ